MPSRKKCYQVRATEGSPPKMVRALSSLEPALYELTTCMLRPMLPVSDFPVLCECARQEDIDDFRHSPNRYSLTPLGQSGP